MNLTHWQKLERQMIYTILSIKTTIIPSNGEMSTILRCPEYAQSIHAAIIMYPKHYRTLEKFAINQCSIFPKSAICRVQEKNIPLYYDLTWWGHTWSSIISRAVYFLALWSLLRSWRFSNSSSEFRYTLLVEVATVCEISLDASILLSVIKAGLLAIAWPINWALLASPWRQEWGKVQMNPTEARLYVESGILNQQDSGK